MSSQNRAAALAFWRRAVYHRHICENALREVPPMALELVDGLLRTDEVLELFEEYTG